MRLMSYFFAVLTFPVALVPAQVVAEAEKVPLTISGRLHVDGDASRYGTLSVDCALWKSWPNRDGQVATYSTGALFRNGVAQVPVDANGYVKYELKIRVSWDINSVDREDLRWTCTAQNNGSGIENAVVQPSTGQIKAPSVEGTIGGHSGVIRSGSGEIVILNAIPAGI